VQLSEAVAFPWLLNHAAMASPFVEAHSKFKSVPPAITGSTASVIVTTWEAVVTLLESSVAVHVRVTTDALGQVSLATEVSEYSRVTVSQQTSEAVTAVKPAMYASYPSQLTV
jgi:hypothetical protein